MAKVVKKTAKKAATKRVTKKKITNLIIIDASGSMQSKVNEVIGGLKQIFSQIRKDMEKDKKKVSMRNIVLDFSSGGDIRTLIDSSSIDDLKDSVADNYSTRGMTALYDAIGKGLSMVDKNDYAVFINILTDGEENDSKEYTSSDITKMIQEAKAKNWAVTFMGTTEQSVWLAQSMGISKGNTMQFADNAAGVQTSLSKTLVARNAYYNGAMSNTGLEGFATLGELDSLLED